MSDLASQLGFDLSSPSQRRAFILEENDATLLRDLIDLRKACDLTQQDVAAMLGVSQATISAFESYDNDPKLSTIRRYAHAIGAMVYHKVERDTEGLGRPRWAADAVVAMRMLTVQENAVAQSGWAPLTEVAS